MCRSFLIKKIYMYISLYRYIDGQQYNRIKKMKFQKKIDFQLSWSGGLEYQLLNKFSNVSRLIIVFLSKLMHGIH